VIGNYRPRTAIPKGIKQMRSPNLNRLQHRSTEPVSETNLLAPLGKSEEKGGDRGGRKGERSTGKTKPQGKILVFSGLFVTCRLLQVTPDIFNLPSLLTWAQPWIVHSIILTHSGPANLGLGFLTRGPASRGGLVDSVPTRLQSHDSRRTPYLSIKLRLTQEPHNNLTQTCTWT
jgi:hypothetical protein